MLCSGVTAVQTQIRKTLTFRPTETAYALSEHCNSYQRSLEAEAGFESWTPRTWRHAGDINSAQETIHRALGFITWNTLLPPYVIIGALSSALRLNPLVKIRDGKFDVSDPFKGPFVESFVKRLGGLARNLSAKDAWLIAKLMLYPDLFADAKPPAIGDVFPGPVKDEHGLLGNRSDNCWAPGRSDMAVIGGQVRDQVKAARSAFVNGFPEKQVGKKPGEGRYLEIGPGWGCLCGDLQPGYRSDFHFLEWNPKLIERLLETHPQIADQIIVGNANELHSSVKPGSYDAIILLTSASSFYNLDLLALECFKALKPGGWFLSMHDGVIPNDQQAAWQLEQRGLFGDWQNCYWFRSKEERDEVDMQLPAPDQKLPQSETWMKYAPYVNQKAAIQNMFEYFYEILQAELNFVGFDIEIPGGPKHLVALAEREERHPCDQPVVSCGAMDGMLIAGMPRDVSGCQAVRELVSQMGRGYVLEHLIAWMVAGKKPEGAF